MNETQPTIPAAAIAEILCKSSSLISAIREFSQALGLPSNSKKLESFEKGSITAYGLIVDLLGEWIIRVDNGSATIGNLNLVLVALGHASLADEVEKVATQWHPGHGVIRIETLTGSATSVINPPGFVMAESNSSTMTEIREHRMIKLEKSWKSLEISNKFKRGKISTELKDQLEALPIFKMKSALIEAVKNNQLIIVVGEAGSGKSTQIPAYLADAGYGENGIIGCTQPRRIAAKSLAERVSQECGTELGTLIGYSVRFEKCYSDSTIIKFMTDGTLVREFSISLDMSEYSVLIIDEAHERSKYTDICFGLLKSILKNHPNLKVIITSATLDEHKFSKYFNSAPILSVTGNVFEVEVVYESIPRGLQDYLEGAVQTVCNIHLCEGPGDILVFLPGQGDIEKAEELIKRKVALNSVEIVPCYGLLTLERQNKIFNPAPLSIRKIALATNIAETSLTIPGIVYVVDCGYFKQSEYNPETEVEALLMKRITQAQAIQRKGRAGRTAKGKVYRLYSEATFNALNPTGIPEIQRCNLESVVLQLIAVGIQDVFNFDWLSIPRKESICEAFEKLRELSALDNNMKLTRIGRVMAGFPLDPTLAKVLVSSVELQCSKDILIIASFLSIEGKQLFLQDKDNLNLARGRMRQFNHPDGDQLTYLNIYNAWKNAGCNEAWCRQNLLNLEFLDEVENIIQQLADDMRKSNLPIIANTSGSTVNIRKSIVSGYYRKIARKVDKYSYTAVGINMPDRLYIHPSSALFPRSPAPDYILYSEAFKTAKSYVKGAIAIEPSWIQRN